MQNKLFKFWALSIFSIFITGILLSGNSLARAADKADINIMGKELVGKYLTDGKGMSLYYFTKDEKNVSHCIEGCAVNWPPFYVDPSTANDGLKQSDFATETRTDGRKQTLYKGRPLYYFKNDIYPGDIFGHGIGDVWFLVTP